MRPWLRSIDAWLCSLTPDEFIAALPLLRRSLSNFDHTGRRRLLTWGAPRIHGELMMLGFDLSERTVLRWMRKAPRHPEPANHWKAFLSNHREAIAAMDFFTVPTLAFGIVYCFL